MISSVTSFYFVLSSEFSVYLKQIKVILSRVKISYFFTSDDLVGCIVVLRPR